jgi:nicotinamide-nucleotide amidase
VRPLAAAEVLSVGSELTTGETRDTNAGELAGDLTRRGVDVRRMTGLPDRLADVAAAIRAALDAADLVVTTGGLGPTPDDLTREAIGASIGEVPAEDPELMAWLMGLFDRRGVPFPEANRKQAWLIPSATSIPNANGTAPGWWVDRPDGRVVIALPGPPREMRPMWHEWCVPRLDARGVGGDAAVVTLRTAGLGESVIADRLGELLATESDPLAATYARNDAVDVRISSHGPGAAERVATAVAEVRSRLQGHVWAEGSTTWAEAVGAALDQRAWRLAIVEVATRGAVVGLLAEGLGDRLAFAEQLTARPPAHEGHEASLERLAARVRELGTADVGLAVEARDRGSDTAVSVAISSSKGDHRERRLAFLAGELGRGRAALTAAAVVLEWLRST